MLGRRDFIRRGALWTLGATVVTPELLDRLTWTRRLWPGADFGRVYAVDRIDHHQSIELFTGRVLDLRTTIGLASGEVIELAPHERVEYGAANPRETFRMAPLSATKRGDVWHVYHQNGGLIGS